jgi:hypothetical protein
LHDITLTAQAIAVPHSATPASADITINTSQAATQITEGFQYAEAKAQLYFNYTFKLGASCLILLSTQVKVEHE